MKAKITIIVPVYNVEGFLSGCLDSLMQQTYKDIKIVCVNDGSTDRSGEILDDYAKKDKRIEVINKKNGGLSSARNAALSKCDTKYVMFCDSDDSFDKKMCEIMLDTIEKDDSDIAVCEKNIIYQVHEEMRASDEKYYALKYSGKKAVSDAVILNTNVSVLNKIFRMSIINEHKIGFPVGINNEDFYFYNAYMSEANTISFVKKPLYIYVRRNNSIMSNNFEAETLSVDHLSAAEKLLDYYVKNGYIEKHSDLFWKQWLLSYWFSMEHSSKSLRGQAMKVAKKFLRENLEKYPPQDKALKKDIQSIMRNRYISAIKRRMRDVVGGAYKKINIGYRQQRYINANIEQLQTKYEKLSERLNRLLEENNG